MSTYQGRSYDPRSPLMSLESDNPKKSHGHGFLKNPVGYIKHKVKGKHSEELEEEDDMDVTIVDKADEEKGRNLLLGKE